MMTFRDELEQALTHLPVEEGALPVPGKEASDEEWEKFRLSRTPQCVEPRDNVGEQVRILTLEESVPVFVQLMEEREVFDSEVWKEIWFTRARHIDGTAMEEPETREESVRAHLNRKCPKAENAAVWVAYRDGKPAHARAFDRPTWNHEEAWVQWIVGVKAVGKPSLRVAQVLYDVGVRRICWKALPNHPLHLHWAKYSQFKRVGDNMPDGWHGNKLYGGGLLNRHYIEYVFEMLERPKKWEEYLK